ncbi:hypothetical protein AAVH_17022, partial [Aphelenchoides avenae]
IHDVQGTDRLELHEVWGIPDVRRDLESLAAELGLRLVYKEPENVDAGTNPGNFSGLWQSSARKGFAFSVKYIVDGYDLVVVVVALPIFGRE